jgi:hypothetical protein
VPEGILFDYKQTTYGRTDADVKEFLKDVSSFANTAGGHLIIGVEEDEGVPIKFSPLSINPDQELQRLESLARDGLEPRIVGLRMRAIEVTGGHVIVLRIPKSFNPPHRVSARNTNRIYGRNSAGAYEFSVDELRVVFTSAASTLDRVRAFRAERLARIDAGEAILPLATGRGRLILHLVPLSSFGLRPQIDLDRAYALHEKLRPIDGSGLTPGFNFDGFANIHHGGDGKCWSYTQIFRNGAIEAVMVHAVTDFHGKPVIPTTSIGMRVFEVLPNYMKALQVLDVPPPIVFMLTLQGIRGAVLGVSTWTLQEQSPIDRAALELPEIIVEQYGSFPDYQRAVRPAFDALWNAGGYSRSRDFNEAGLWSPRPML